MKRCRWNQWKVSGRHGYVEDTDLYKDCRELSSMVSDGTVQASDDPDLDANTSDSGRLSRFGVIRGRVYLFDPAPLFLRFVMDNIQKFMAAFAGFETGMDRQQLKVHARTARKKPTLVLLGHR